MPKASGSKSSGADRVQTVEFSRRFLTDKVVHMGSRTPLVGVTKSIQSNPNELLDFDKGNRINSLGNMPKS